MDFFSHFSVVNGLIYECVSISPIPGEKDSYKAACCWKVSSLFTALYYTKVSGNLAWCEVMTIFFPMVLTFSEMYLAS